MRFGPSTYFSLMALPIAVSLCAAIRVHTRHSAREIDSSSHTGGKPLLLNCEAGGAAAGANDASVVRDARLWSILPLILVLSWVDGATFGVQNAVLPFAARNTDASGGLGSLALQDSLLAGSFGLPIGAWAAMALPKWRSPAGLALVFTISFAVLMAAAAGVSPSFWTAPHLGPPTLVLAAGLCRALESYTNTIVMVLISERHGPQHAPRLSFWTGVVDRLLTTVATGAGIVVVKWLQGEDAHVAERQC